MENPVVTVPEACVALRIGKTSLYAQVKRGALTVVKIGRKTLITTDSIRALVENGVVA